MELINDTTPPSITVATSVTILLYYRQGDALPDDPVLLIIFWGLFDRAIILLVLSHRMDSWLFPDRAFACRIVNDVE